MNDAKVDRSAAIMLKCSKALRRLLLKAPITEEEKTEIRLSLYRFALKMATDGPKNQGTMGFTGPHHPCERGRGSESNDRPQGSGAQMRDITKEESTCNLRPPTAVPNIAIPKPRQPLIIQKPKRKLDDLYRIEVCVRPQTAATINTKIDQLGRSATWTREHFVMASVRWAVSSSDDGQGEAGEQPATAELSDPL